ncbi:dipeptide ABC transporter ATP-binding protein [Mycobacterium sp. BMJ-28]
MNPENPPPQRALLSVDGLTVAYGRGSHRHIALHDVEFTVEPGESVAVVGESGSGKSTLAHTILGLLPASADAVEGSVRLDGEQILGRSRRDLDALRGSRISLVPQDPTVSLNPVHRIGAQVAEVLSIHGQPKSVARERAVDLLDEVGLPDAASLANRYPHELSGGMRQRVLIAIALACRPALVIADEPTSALDVTVQKRVLDALDSLAARHGTAVLLITHDLGIALQRASRVLVFERGRLVEHGDAASILTAPRHPYTRQLVAAAPILGLSTRLSPRLPVAAATPGEEPDMLVTASNLRKTFRTGRGPRQRTTAAVDDVSFTIARGATHTLVGESGSGKSTVARILARLETPDAGTVSLGRHAPHDPPAGDLRAWRRRVQLVYQNPYSSLDPRASVQSIVREPLDSFGIGSKVQRSARVRELLDQVALPERAARSRPGELSGGQRQRVAVARALALKPQVLILDEPVSALDVSVQDRVLRLLVDLQAEHELTYLFITHDLAVVQQVSDTVSVMQMGRIVDEGTTEQVLSHSSNPFTKTLLDAVPRVEVSA